MHDALILELPFPPSVNRIWRQYQGRTLVSRQYRAWKNEAMTSLSLQTVGRVPDWIGGPLYCCIYLQPDNARRWDIDNRTKACLDALESIGFDDSQIDLLRVERLPPGSTQECRVELGPYTEPQDPRSART